MAADSTGVDLRGLADDFAGDVIVPGDDSWDAARQAWNLAVDQRPVAVVLPESAEDIVATVRFAAAKDLRIAFNAGGHNAGPIDWSVDTVLLKTERMTRIEIDERSRCARVEAGVLGSLWRTPRASTVSATCRARRPTPASSATRSAAASAG